MEALGVTTTGRLMRIPVSGGVPQLVLEMAKGWDYACARAPASLCVVVEASQDEKHLTVTAFDPLKGRGKVLRTIDKDPSVNYYVMGLSPDGTTFALSKSDEPEIHIRLLSLSGGSDRETTVKGGRTFLGGVFTGPPTERGFFAALARRKAALFSMWI